MAYVETISLETHNTMSFSIRWCIVPKWEVMTRANPERQPKILHFVQDVTSERERLCRMGAAARLGILVCDCVDVFFRNVEVSTLGRREATAGPSTALRFRRDDTV